MVGQKMVMEILKTFIDNDNFPRFVIISGPRGCGKKALASYIAKHFLQGFEIYPGNGVESVREAIDNSYRCAGTTVFIFPDSDKMSVQAKNAMLKITEEPPRQAYFIMTVESMNNTLGTLKSRGTEIQMENYTQDELSQLVDDNSDNSKMALKIATNPGQLYQLLKMNVNEFYHFCEKVLDNVASVTGVNAFKIGSNFRFKDSDTEGYDPVLFFECIKTICLDRSRIETVPEKLKALARTIKVTSAHERDLSLTGVKKDSTFDMWILEMREIWQSLI